jgi:hypothetical protein
VRFDNSEQAAVLEFHHFRGSQSHEALRSLSSGEPSIDLIIVVHMTFATVPGLQ